jgi:hypothetical protein
MFYRWFEYTVIFLILFNSICLASYDFSDRDNKTKRNIVLNAIGYVFNAVFIIECILKIISKGFIIHKNSYLRDGWNIIDFIVVITAVMEMLPLGKFGANF